MLSAAVVVSYGLGTGFDRSARAASLPDIIVRFNNKSAADVAAVSAPCPNIARFQLRFELTNVGIGFGGRRRDDAVAEVLDPGPRAGYAVVAGRTSATAAPSVLLERAFADSWGIRFGDTFYVRGLGPQRVAGFVEAPDNVGYPARQAAVLPLPSGAGRALRRRAKPAGEPRRDLAAQPRATLNEVLVQARATSFGLHSISFATRSGVRVLLDQAAGIVIDLLVALSVIALVTAGVMLAASARAEVQRRLGAIGVRRAVGETRGRSSRCRSLEGLLVAVPAAPSACGRGARDLRARRRGCSSCSTSRRPGGALVLPLVGAWARRRRWCRRWAPRGRRGGPAAGRWWRCCGAPTSRLRVGGGTPWRRRRPRRARRAARRRRAGSGCRDGADARAVGRVRAADARAGLGAVDARDRPGRARQALPADRDRAPSLAGRGRADPRRRRPRRRATRSRRRTLRAG